MLENRNIDLHKSLVERYVGCGSFAWGWDMDQTHIFINVHEEDHTSDPILCVDKDVTIGTTEDADIRLNMSERFLFTLIRFDRKTQKAFLQFTNGLDGLLNIAGKQIGLRKATQRNVATGIPGFGLWTIELPPDSSGFIAIGDFAGTISWRIECRAARSAAHAA